MKTALVMGISGGFGASVAEALAERGWNIRALMRNPARLPARFGDAQVVTGDAADQEAVRSAARGAELLVYGVNPPGYKWKGTALPMLDVAATVAEEQATTLLFPGNVYVFDPAEGPCFDERSPLRPPTPLGEIRLAMEQRLQQAASHGAKVILLRMGDFMGARAPHAWLGALIKRRRYGFTLSTPGPRNLLHTWAYLPDVATAAAQIVELGERLPAWNVFHFRGYRLSAIDLANALRTASGRHVKLRAFPWWLLRPMAPFSHLFRGLLELRYLWNREVHLDDRCLRQTLGGPPPSTPLTVALREMGFGEL